MPKKLANFFVFQRSVNKKYLLPISQKCRGRGNPLASSSRAKDRCHFPSPFGQKLTHGLKPPRMPCSLGSEGLRLRGSYRGTSSAEWRGQTFWEEGASRETEKELPVTSRPEAESHHHDHGTHGWSAQGVRTPGDIQVLAALTDSGPNPTACLNPGKNKETVQLRSYHRHFSAMNSCVMLFRAAKGDFGITSMLFKFII